MWNCSNCTFANAEIMTNCEMCNAGKSLYWACPSCTLDNEQRSLICTVCETPNLLRQPIQKFPINSVVGPISAPNLPDANKPVNHDQILEQSNTPIVTPIEPGDRKKKKISLFNLFKFAPLSHTHPNNVSNAIPGPSHKLVGNGKIVECSICFTESNQGLRCQKGHLVCQENCVSKYLVSICEERARMKDHGGTVHCPSVGCTSPPWTARDIRTQASLESYDVYVDTLVALVGVTSGTIKQASSDDKDMGNNVPAQISDCLTLKCPNKQCKTGLDPSPDGCAAMRCVQCGDRFCWLCFADGFISSSTAHDHVRVCPVNSSKGNLFPSKKNIEAAHKQRRMEGVQQVLQRHHGDKWPTVAAATAQLTAMNALLKSCDITPQQVLKHKATLTNIDTTPGEGGERVAGAGVDVGDGGLLQRIVLEARAGPPMQLDNVLGALRIMSKDTVMIFLEEFAFDLYMWVWIVNSAWLLSALLMFMVIGGGTDHLINGSVVGQLQARGRAVSDWRAVKWSCGALCLVYWFRCLRSWLYPASWWGREVFSCVLVCAWTIYSADMPWTSQPQENHKNRRLLIVLSTLLF